MEDVDVNDAAVKEAVQRACEDVGLPLVYRAVVLRMLRIPSTEWPACCGDSCTPCQQTLADAAHRTLELLGRSLPR